MRFKRFSSVFVDNSCIYYSVFIVNHVVKHDAQFLSNEDLMVEQSTMSGYIQLGRALDLTSLPVCLVDKTSYILWANAAYKREFDQFKPLIHCDNGLSRDEAKSCWESVLSGKLWHTSFFKNDKAYSLQVTPIPDVKGKPSNFMVHLHDVTENYQRSLQLEQAAQTDSLTKLLNKRGFEEKLHTFDSLQGDICLIYLDLDKFKPINDTFGHHVGDAVLTHFADTLKQSVRENDIAARLGGDEFAVLVHGDIFLANQIIQRIRDGFSFSHDDRSLDVGFSSGIAIRVDDESMMQLVIKADQLMYKAKQGKVRT